MSDQIETAMMASVNFGEVAQVLLRDGATRTQVGSLAQAIHLDIRDVDLGLALDAAEMRESARQLGLSQADCICLALGRRENAMILTGDRVWSAMAETANVTVQLIR